MGQDSYRILLVCLGNICRSPTAEAVLREKSRAAGLGDRIQVDSAGTGPWHVGEAPDPRADSAAAARGYSLQGLVGRQISPADFSAFDQILAMDSSNLKNLRALRSQALSGPNPELFLDYSTRFAGDVPDPYYGGDSGFAEVLDRIEDAADGLVAAVRKRLEASE